MYHVVKAYVMLVLQKRQFGSLCMHVIYRTSVSCYICVYTGGVVGFIQDLVSTFRFGHGPVLVVGGNVSSRPLLMVTRRGR